MDKSISGKVFLVHVDIGLISPTRLAGEDRIKDILGVHEIPKTMRALLAQEVIDRKLLNPLEAIKGRVRSLLLKHGTRTPLLGWVVDPDHVDALYNGIREEARNFDEAKAALLASYEPSCRLHLSSLRKRIVEENIAGINIESFLSVVRNAQPSKRYLEERLNFAFLKPRAIDLNDEEYRAITLSVFDQALVDISAKARACLRLIRPNKRVEGLKEICGKLKGLSYLDPRLQRVSDDIRATLIRMPDGVKDVDWPTPEQVVMEGLLSLLKNPAQIRERIDRMGDEAMFSDIWDTSETVVNLDKVQTEASPVQVPLAGVSQEATAMQCGTPTLTGTGKEAQEPFSVAAGFSTW